MLTLCSGTNGYPMAQDDYFVKEMYSGIDEVGFNVPINDELYKHVFEEATVIDNETGLRYKITAIDSSGSYAKVVCTIDLDELKATGITSFTNNNGDIVSTIESVLPTGWSVIDRAYITTEKEIKLDGATPLSVIEACAATFGVTFRYNNIAKAVTIIDPDSYNAVGAFVTDELNLKDLSYKGKSSDIVTRLYAVGANGLTFASINDGKAYVDNNAYTNTVIASVLIDNQCTVAADLLAQTTKTLESLAKPQSSYTCKVVDLAKTNPGIYNFLDLSLFNVVTLIDNDKQRRVNHQVVQYLRYPNYPERNVVTLSTVTPTIQSSVANLQYQVEAPNSPFQQSLQAAINNATSMIVSGAAGYVVLTQNAQGKMTEICIMDTEDKETATKVWRWNSGGLGYSSTGYNGNYATAITADGAIVANFITSGVMNANRIRAGKLISQSVVTGTNIPRFELDLDNGNISFKKLSGELVLQFKSSPGAGEKSLFIGGDAEFAGTINAVSGTFVELYAGNSYNDNGTITYDFEMDARHMQLGHQTTYVDEHGDTKTRYPVFFVQAGDAWGGWDPRARIGNINMREGRTDITGDVYLDGVSLADYIALHSSGSHGTLPVRDTNGLSHILWCDPTVS